MGTAQRIIKNTAFLLIARIIALFLSFIAVIYLARILEPGDFGKINFAMAVIAYFAVIVNLGLPTLGTRQVAREKNKIKDYLGNIIALRLCLVLLAFGLLLLFVSFIREAVEVKYLIILYALSLIPASLLCDWAFQALEKMGYIGISRILREIAYVGLVLLFVKNFKQLLLIPSFYVLGNFLAGGVLIFIFVKKFGKFRLRFNPTFWKVLILQALPIGLSIIMIQIIYNIDTVMLGFMKTVKEVGYYSAAYKIILVFIGLGSVYFEATFPLVSNYYKTSLASLQRLQKFSIKLMVTLAIPLAAGGTILARQIMDLIYGPKYESGIIAFQILIWAAALIYLNMIYAGGLWACDRQNKYLIIVSFQAVTNVVLNLILIPSLGLKGAAIATVVAEFLGLIFYGAAFKKIVLVPFHKYILRPLMASIIMSLFLYWGLNNMNLGIFSLIMGGTAIYITILISIKGITLEEIKLIGSSLLTVRQ